MKIKLRNIDSANVYMNLVLSLIVYNFIGPYNFSLAIYFSIWTSAVRCQLSKSAAFDAAFVVNSSCIAMKQMLIA
jgi:hypothetical protein